MSTATKGNGQVNAEKSLREAELPDVLHIKHICSHLGIHPRTLTRIRQQGDFPPPFAVGKRPRWLRSTYLEWIHRGGTQST